MYIYIYIKFFPYNDPLTIATRHNYRNKYFKTEFYIIYNAI